MSPGSDTVSPGSRHGESRIAARWSTSGGPPRRAALMRRGGNRISPWWIAGLTAGGAPAAGRAAPPPTASRAGRASRDHRLGHGPGDGRRTARGHHDVADPVDHVRAERAEPAVRDGLLARHHPPGVAQHRPPGREHVRRRAGAGVDVPGAPVPADRGHVAAQVGMGVGVEDAVDGRPCRGRPSPAAARRTAAPRR